MPSRAEGGASVVSEAVVRGKPILATRIPGNVGLLGARHPGLFPPGDAARLAALLVRCARDARFVARLRRASLGAAVAFTPARERAAWSRLLRELGTDAPRARRLRE